MPAGVESTARHLIRDLENKGYQVERGYFKCYTQSDCPYTCEVKMPCLGNNPDAPYVIPGLPAWPDEWIDPGTAGMSGPTLEDYNACYHLDPSEAILMLGLSLRSYIPGHTTGTCCRIEAQSAGNPASATVNARE